MLSDLTTGEGCMTSDTSAGDTSDIATASPRSAVPWVWRACERRTLVRDARAPMSVRETARGAELARTVVPRLLPTLQQQDIVLGERGLSRLGPASILLANSYLDNLLVRRLALPYMV